MQVSRLIPCGLAVGALAFTATPAAARAPDAPASVRVLACSPWQEGEGGSVRFEARMRTIAGARRMALKIHLREKMGDGRYHRVAAEGLGVWRKSHRGARGLRWEQQVRGLRQGGVYRAAVRYRWFDGDGREIDSARLVSAPCRQGGGPPNLRIADVDVRRGEVEGTASYRVTVVNRGESDARGVGVLLRVDGEVVDETETIEVLAPGASSVVTFSGPVCRQHLRVVVDPKQAIAESREEDNVRASTCV